MSDDVHGQSATDAQRALVEAVLRAHAGGASLRDLLALAPLQPEQRSALDLFLTMNESGRPAGRAIDEMPPDEGGIEDQDDDEPEYAARELADLRQANDTLASALGACPLCWGGNPRCAICHGRGSPGYAVPDRTLFGELVLPAVARVRDVQRSDPRARARRARAGRPLHAEVPR